MKYIYYNDMIFNLENFRSVHIKYKTPIEYKGDPLFREKDRIVINYFNRDSQVSSSYVEFEVKDGDKASDIIKEIWRVVRFEANC